MQTDRATETETQRVQFSAATRFAKKLARRESAPEERKKGARAEHRKSVIGKKERL
jgi:hypothetical protein